MYWCVAVRCCRMLFQQYGRVQLQMGHTGYYLGAGALLMMIAFMSTLGEIM